MLAGESVYTVNCTHDKFQLPLRSCIEGCNIYETPTEFENFKIAQQLREAFVQNIVAKMLWGFGILVWLCLFIFEMSKFGPMYEFLFNDVLLIFCACLMVIPNKWTLFLLLKRYILSVLWLYTLIESKWGRTYPIQRQHIADARQQIPPLIWCMGILQVLFGQ